MILLSIIIPIYKVEKYLQQCVDSVIQQQLDNIEIILVDDGSTDLCSKICDKYLVNHKYIKVIHKENGGISSARNTGINLASGDYIVFLDSDDWWNSDVPVREMLNDVDNNKEVDMFLFTSYDYVEGKGLFKRKEHQNLDRIRTDTVEHYYYDLLLNGNLEVHAATKIIKKNFLISNNLYFKYGITGEDNEWIIRLLRNLKMVKVLNFPLYIYRSGRNESISNTINIKNIVDLLEIVKSSMSYYDKRKEKSNIMNYELCFCSYLWFCALGLSNRINMKKFKSIKPLFKETQSICEYSISRKTKLCNSIIKIFGMNCTRFVLKFYLDIFRKNNRIKYNKAVDMTAVF